MADDAIREALTPGTITTLVQSDRVAELEAQVRMLRKACRKADVLLTSFAVARNFTEHQKDAAVEVLVEIVAALAATAPKGETCTPAAPGEGR